MTQLTYFQGKFAFYCSYNERHLASDAGFRWDVQGKYWYTYNKSSAARLSDYADSSAKTVFNRKSHGPIPWAGRIRHPKNQKPYKFQEDAVRFALGQDKSYLGLDPGLGKTVIAAMIVNTEPSNAIYICPPFLCESVIEKFSNWLTNGRTVAKYVFPFENEMPNVLVIPDSMIAKPTTQEMVGSFVRRSTKVRLFVDEAHRFKELKAKRTKALFEGIEPLFEKVTYLSGSPMPNRPIELFPVLHYSAPWTIDNMNKFEYGQKYCAAFKNRWGWDFSGASNMEELGRRVKQSFMMRLRSKDADLKLPPLREEMVIIDDRMPPTASKVDKELLKTKSPADLMKARLGDPHVATYRKAIGNAKVEHVISYIRDILDETDEKVLVFAHHKEVIEKLVNAFPMVFAITGSTPVNKRQEIVDRFQKDDGWRVLIGQIQAAGIGFDITSATRVVFAEYSWTPEDNHQALKRAHRLGQTESVLVQYLVYKNSMDRKILETILKKKRVISYV